MNAPARNFEAKPAVRESVPLLVGLMGCSGSGKTFSALRLATGIQQVTGGDIFGLDTEARRMLHYADHFRFHHVMFGAPFGSLDYLAAIQYCVDHGAKVVVIDSMSHEHIGPGGYLLTQEAEVDRMAGNDYAKRERVKMAGWIKPAGLRQRMITGILQLNVNLIFCFRAKEKTKPKPGGGIQELGFMPIAGEELLFEMTVNCLLLPKSNGFPTWSSEQVGERTMMKKPLQFEKLFADERALDEQIGVALATWARGGAAHSAAKPESEVMPSGPEATGDPAVSTGRTNRSDTPPRPAVSEPGGADIERVMQAAAEQGMDTLKTAWMNLDPDERAKYKAALERRWKPTAIAADEKAGAQA